jgi:hypothetical protein
MTDTLPGSPILPDAPAPVVEAAVTPAEAKTKTADFKRFLEMDSVTGKADEKELEAFEAKLAPPVVKPKAKKPKDEPDPGEHPADETTDGGESPDPEKGETEQTPAKVDVELLAKSTQALKRYGMTAAWLNKHSDEEIVEAGTPLLKIQEDNDKAQSELKTLKLKATTEKPADDGNTPAPVAADLSKWTKALAEKGYEDIAPDVVALVNEATKDLRARVVAAEEKAAAVEASREAERVRSVVDAALNEVAGEYPTILTDSGARDKLLELAQKRAGGYAAGEEAKCLRAAAIELDLPQKSSGTASPVIDAKASTNGRRNGLPSANGRASPVTQLSKADLEKKAMVAFEDGDRTEGQRLMTLASRV